MGALIANGGTVRPTTAPPATPIVVGNDGFWPALDLDKLREETRLTGNVTDDRLKASAIDAMVWANDKLKAFKARQVAVGWDTAEDIEGPKIDGVSVLVHRYRRAVISAIQADIAEKYRDWDTSRAGDYRAQFEATAAEDFRRNANWAVAGILERGRTVVELI